LDAPFDFPFRLDCEDSSSDPASPIPVALLPASAAPLTAPFAAPAAAPTSTCLKVFLAFFRIPGDDRLARFFAPPFFPDFRLKVDFPELDFFLLPDFFEVFLVAIRTPPYNPHEATLPQYEEALPAVDNALASPPKRV
jgi:hypothetical protein